MQLTSLNNHIYGLVSDTTFTTDPNCKTKKDFNQKFKTGVTISFNGLTNRIKSLLLNLYLDKMREGVKAMK